MENTVPKEAYQLQIKELQAREKDLLQKKTILSWARFLSLVASFILLWQLWPSGIIIAFGSFVFLFGLFLFIVVKDLRNKEEIANTRLLIQLSEQEIKILDHHFLTLPDGQSLQPANHPYSNDLDIFGKASLYQYTNRTASEQGQQLFANWLLYPANPESILQRQEAAKELSAHTAWRHQFRAYGITNPLTVQAENKIGNWLSAKNKFAAQLLWKIIRFGIPAIAITVLILFITDTIQVSLFYPLLLLLFMIASAISKIIKPYYQQLDKIVPELETLQNSIRWIEKSSFTTPLLQQLKTNLANQNSTASSSIKNLKSILERFDYRFNPLVHVPLNTFFLWDLQQMIALEKWRSRNTHTIAVWFRTLAEAEALTSIATLAFNHPDWSYPVLSNEPAVFTGDDLGHPLIPSNKRVVNSFSTTGQKQLSLITGSNMAGKSTFLRTIGINITLAMAGAPVCARRMNISPVKVISTMRVNDNLEENTSTFYAELKKLKEIIEAVNNHEQVFLLLDEILRGTNSADRHTGSKALIRQLMKENAVGMIATHDLELAKLESDFPGHLHNYHFDVQVQNEELYFDYKIKKGVCTSMNASLLMKKIGIEIDKN
jgi:hypothetical protein